MSDAAKADPQKDKAGAEAQGQQSGNTEAKKSLDDLIGDFAKETQPTGSKEKAEDPKASDTVTLTKAQLVEIEKRIAETVTAGLKAETKATNDFGDLAEKIKEEAGVGKKTAERYLLGAIQGDQRLLTAWLGRHSNPKSWAEIAKALVSEAAEEISAAGEKKGGTDRRANASVRAAANRTTGAPAKAKVDFSKMSDAEFAAYKRENLRQ